MARRPRTIELPGARAAIRPISVEQVKRDLARMSGSVPARVLPVSTPAPEQRKYVPPSVVKPRRIDSNSEALHIPKHEIEKHQRTEQLKILVRMPTRDRAQQALDRIAEYRRLAGRPIDVEVVVDENDESMRRLFVLKALRDLDCTITVGRHKTKIEAVNGGRVTGWDILVLASDDMVPITRGWAIHVERDMREHFPQLDGALHYNDGLQGERLYTLPIMGRRLYEQFGYVYEPAYQSLWCDNEQGAVLRKMKRLMYIPKRIVEHHHHVGGKANNDALYKRNDAAWNVDKQTFKAREARGFDTPKMRLSIMIPTMPSRAEFLRRLLEHLWKQALRHPRQVEILTDAGHGTTGEKRQRLLERAIGQYVASIDDDDWVSEDYIDRIFAALDKCPDADCAELHVLMLSGGQEHRGHCSIKYTTWKQEGGVFQRCPNHLSPVKRELALKVGFPKKTIGEDADYSMLLRHHLKVEAPMPSTKPLYFYFPRS